MARCAGFNARGRVGKGGGNRGRGELPRALMAEAGAALRRRKRGGRRVARRWICIQRCGESGVRGRFLAVRFESDGGEREREGERR